MEIFVCKKCSYSSDAPYYMSFVFNYDFCSLTCALEYEKDLIIKSEVQNES